MSASDRLASERGAAARSWLRRTQAGAAQRLQGCLSSSPTWLRRLAGFLIDAALVMEAFVVASFFRFDGMVPGVYWSYLWPFAACSAALFVVLMYREGVYRSVSRYTGVHQALRVANATFTAVTVLLAADLALEVVWVRPMPLSVILLGVVLAYVQLVGVRMYPRVFYERSLREVDGRERALIVGAGEAGVTLARQLWMTPDTNLEPVGFVDEDASLHGEQIEGVPVLGGPENIEGIVEEQEIDQVLIALRSAGPEEMDRVWRECAKTDAAVKVIPSLGETLAQGAMRLRDFQIQDLLGREPVDLDLASLVEFVSGKRVLITGAGGSIGSELSRQISRLGPARLALLDRDESALFYLSEELNREGFSEAEVVVGDVTHQDRLEGVFGNLRPHLVFHAAAYKHVPLMEVHASEAINNNAGGTLNVARAAGRHGAEKFINVSTDKAVNPANVMGATKRLAEMIVRATAKEYPETVYASVRFGNVLGSRGSVVPTFKRQIEAGGPVTVTHPEMTRYFMSIPEAVSLIVQAGAMVDSYATYVLEMGRPVRILDLAQKMIEITGAKNVEIKYTGLRPGEKLREELFGADEQRAPTDSPMVFRLLPKKLPSPNLLRSVEEAVLLAREQDDRGALELLQKTVDCRMTEAPLQNSPSAVGDLTTPRWRAS